MLALSIRQPWAWLILNAGKDIENRDWPTKIRGRFLIHAAKGMTRTEYEEVKGWLWVNRMNIDLPKPWELERGGIVGAAEIVDCVTESRSFWFVGRHGFVLRNPEPLPFMPYKGKLGFFRITQPIKGDPMTKTSEAPKIEATEGETATATPQEEKPAAPRKADVGILKMVMAGFLKRIHVPFTEGEFADRARRYSAIDQQIALKEMEKKDFDTKINNQIKDLEAERQAISDAVARGGAEVEINVRKFIDFDKSIAQLIVDDETSPHHLTILEERKLNMDELQTEMKLANDKTLKGKWPEDKKVGEAEGNPPEPNWEKMQEDKANKEKGQVDAAFAEDTPEDLSKQAGRKKRGRSK